LQRDFLPVTLQFGLRLLVLARLRHSLRHVDIEEADCRLPAQQFNEVSG